MIAVCVSTQQLGGTGGCSPRNFFEIRCSEVTSEALLGQKLPLEKNFLQFTIQQSHSENNEAHRFNTPTK